jgi:hypothetical protein
MDNPPLVLISWNAQLRFRKKLDICVTLHPSSLRSTLSTPHSSGFASLDLGLFTKPSGMQFYEFITINERYFQGAHMIQLLKMCQDDPDKIMECKIIVNAASVRDQEITKKVTIHGVDLASVV